MQNNLSILAIVLCNARTWIITQLNTAFATVMKVKCKDWIAKRQYANSFNLIYAL